MKLLKTHLYLECNAWYLSFFCITPCWFVMYLVLVTIYPEIFILEWRDYGQNLGKLIFSFYFICYFLFFLCCYTVFFFWWLYWVLYCMFFVYCIDIIINNYYYIKLLNALKTIRKFRKFRKKHRKYYYMSVKFYSFFIRVICLFWRLRIYNFVLSKEFFINKDGFFLYFSFDYLHIILFMRFEFWYIIIYSFFRNLDIYFVDTYCQLGGPLSFIGF